MMQRLAKVVESVDRLSLRERLFVFAAGLFVIGGAWQAVLAGPLEAREALANEKVAALEQRLFELEASLSTVAAGAAEGLPEQVARLEALRESVQARGDELRVFTSDLVDPVQMRVVLEELLRRQEGLTLVSAINRPAQPLLDEEHAASSEPLDATTAGSDAPKLYRHSFVLKLRGNYLDALRYLEAIEQLPWHIYWSRLELATDEYPVNDIVIELATLSVDEEWIGV